MTSSVDDFFMVTNCDHRKCSGYKSLRPQARNKHGACVVGFFEAAMFVEGEFFVVGDHDNTEVILVYLVNLVDEDFADAFALVFWAHEQVMHVGIHNAVIHGTNHTNELVAVPSRKDSLEVFHRDNELVREMSRGPFDGEKEVF